MQSWGPFKRTAFTKQDSQNGELLRIVWAHVLLVRVPKPNEPEISEVFLAEAIASRLEATSLRLEAIPSRFLLLGGGHRY